ncbi:hypothetical protein FRB93_004977 [Tulasnella sp. JGI-2019a]|nr:hypothetical protein FRB93_004977 [Tulasnella sp. JGI-2019a]
MREWLRPLHPFPDETTEIGAPWEIRKIPDTYGRPRRWYGKGGNLLVYQSQVYFNPDAGFGVVVLRTGRYRDPESIAHKVAQIYQTAFDFAIGKNVAELYAGRWLSDDGNSEAITALQDGSLWFLKMVVNGTDIFQSLEGPHPVSKRFGLWATGKEDEFRIAVGQAMPNGLCFPFWESFDPLYAREAPIDLVLFEGIGLERSMKVPSVGGTLIRRERQSQ